MAEGQPQREVNPRIESLRNRAKDPASADVFSSFRLLQTLKVDKMRQYLNADVAREHDVDQSWTGNSAERLAKVEEQRKIVADEIAKKREADPEYDRVYCEIEGDYNQAVTVLLTESKGPKSPGEQIRIEKDLLAELAMAA